jgi:hypothetical protein
MVLQALQEGKQTYTKKMVMLIRTFFQLFLDGVGGGALFFAWYVTVLIEMRFQIQMRSVGTPSLCSFAAHADIFDRNYEQRM